MPINGFSLEYAAIYQTHFEYFQRHAPDFENYDRLIVSNRYFRVMISWKEGTNQVKIRHKIGTFQIKVEHKISIKN